MRTSGLGEMRVYPAGSAITDVILATFFVTYLKGPLDKVDSKQIEAAHTDYPTIKIDALPVYTGAGRTLSDIEILKLSDYEESGLDKAEAFNCNSIDLLYFCVI